MAEADQGPRTPDGRRTGPVAVGTPSDDDREIVVRLQQQAAERRQRELDAVAEAAEPAGEPPSQGQRDAVVRTREQSARVRGDAARALRRQPVPVGTIYDDERETVEDLHQDARDRRLEDLANRGISDPVLEAETAGFDPELPNLPGSELFGVFTCPTCNGQVERAFPGYVDWDLASRDLTCPHCGGIVLRGGTQAPAEPAPESPTRATSATPPDVQTSAQTGVVDMGGGTLPTGVPGASSPPPLTDDERAELEQLRADRAARQAAEPAPPAEQTEQTEPTDQPTG